MQIILHRIDGIDPKVPKHLAWGMLRLESGDSGRSSEIMTLAEHGIIYLTRPVIHESSSDISSTHQTYSKRFRRGRALLLRMNYVQNIDNWMCMLLLTDLGMRTSTLERDSKAALSLHSFRQAGSARHAVAEFVKKSTVARASAGCLRV